MKAFLITLMVAGFVATLAAQETPGGASAFTVEVDYSEAPECKEFATKAKAIVEEWYPKINEILFSKDHPLPFKVVHMKYKPMKGIAYTTDGHITISSAYVTKNAPNDFGMVVHELTHVVQNYKGKVDGWVTEGIADYVRHQFFEKDGDTLKKQIHPVKSNYRQAYTTAAAFFIWLEATKDKELVHKLNAAANGDIYSLDLFTKNCGADVDALWKEFVTGLRVKP